MKPKKDEIFPLELLEARERIAALESLLRSERTKRFHIEQARVVFKENFKLHRKITILENKLKRLKAKT